MIQRERVFDVIRTRGFGRTRESTVSSLVRRTDRRPDLSDTLEVRGVTPRERHLRNATDPYRHASTMDAGHSPSPGSR